MSTPDPTTRSLLQLAGFDPTHDGLLSAFEQLGDARSLLAAFLCNGDDIATLQGARAHLDRAASHVVVGVTRDEAGRVQPVIVSADVPADRPQTCGTAAARAPMTTGTVLLVVS